MPISCGSHTFIQTVMRPYKLLYRQFCGHSSAIGIADNLMAQVHNKSQIDPAFLQNMDIGNICTLFLMDGFRLKVTV